MKKILIIISLFLFLNPIVFAQEDLAVSSKSAILMDFTTKEVLYEKNADEKLPPASMTKIMSMLLIMEAINNHKLSMDDFVTISKNASNMGGSQLFLQENESYQVKELLKGIAVASGNDAVVAMAEKIGGSVSDFVEMMNTRAQELGLTNTHFANPHGLDDDNHYSSAKDMAIIASELLKYPDILQFTSIYEDYLKKNDGSSIWLVNTNKLVRFYDGVDGLKTGFTTKAGYCLTATAKKQNLRLISVVMGLPSSDERTADTTSLLNYGFNTYELHNIFNKETSLGEKRVEYGKEERINLILKDDYVKLLKKTDNLPTYSFEIDVDVIKAPVQKGDEVGKAKVILDGQVVDEVAVTVDHDVLKANFLDFVKKNFQHLTAGKNCI